MTGFLLLMLLPGVPEAGEGPAFLEVPAGSFVMGCEPLDTCPERMLPKAVVFERPFLLNETEVTVRHFRRFVEATGYRTEAERGGDPWSWRNIRAFRIEEDQPVVYVTRADADAYCAWIGARLPTESEWTYAFRAEETVRGRLWWDTDPRYVWYRENSEGSPRPVATRLPNAWGFYDLEGNAWEWTVAERPGESPYAIRGGSWVTCPVIESAPRPPGEPEPNHGFFTRCESDGVVHIRDDVGFRCARDLTPR
jgi:formylglycine-generating enzyme required for sulfatase activity